MSKKKRRVLFEGILLSSMAVNMLLPMMPEVRINDGNDSNYGEILDRKEILDMRTENTKTYEIGDEKYQLVTSADRIHYKDKENDTWIDIENSLIPCADSEYDYCNLNNDLRLFISSDAQRGIRYSFGGGEAEIALEGVNTDSKLEIQQNTATYTEVFPGVNWEIGVYNSEIINELVINREAADQQYLFKIKGVGDTQIEELGNTSVAAVNSGRVVWETQKATAYNSRFEDVEVLNKPLKIKSENDVLLGKDKTDITMNLGINKGSIEEDQYPIRLDPSMSVSVLSDTFVSPSSKNPNNGRRRFMPIGTYTDYTMNPPATFKQSRALIYFGQISLPKDAVPTGASLSLWHYGTNSNNGQIMVGMATGAWDEWTTWPGPGFEGDYGTARFPYYNSNKLAVRRDITLNPVAVDVLSQPNHGIYVRNTVLDSKGVVVCSRNIPSGPCGWDMHPQFVIEYFVNQAPKQPELGTPNSGWELGPRTNYLQGVNCDTSGTGKGCKINYRYKTDDPDNSLPLTNYGEIIRKGGGNRNFAKLQQKEGWDSVTKTNSDGEWSWKVRTKDGYGKYGKWSITKHFLVDTKAPTIPNMVDEPKYTQGTQNYVRCSKSNDNLIGGVEYYFQASKTSNFSNIVKASGWIDSNAFTFGGLKDGQKYFYRARARDGLWNKTSWGSITSSIQDNTYPAIINLSLDPIRISPKNQDGKYDFSWLSFGVNEDNWDSNTVLIRDKKNNVVKTYDGLRKKVDLKIDGKRDNGNWLDDGFYKIRIISKDAAGNVTKNDDLVLVIDNTDAVINLSEPENGSWNNVEMTDVYGITDKDASVELENLQSGEKTEAEVDGQTGIFTSKIGVILGENTIEIAAKDPVGNQSSARVSVRKEISVPSVNGFSPTGIIKDRMPVISISLIDEGYIDPDGNSYISGISYQETSLIVENVEGDQIVLIEQGENVSDFGHIEHDCGYDELGGSGSKECNVRYVFDNEFQPDGEYVAKVSVADYAGNKSESEFGFELDSHTHLEFLRPDDGAVFNHSRVNIFGTGERGSEIQVAGGYSNVGFLLDPEGMAESVNITNCEVSGDPRHDGIKEVCEWEVLDFQLDHNLNDPGIVEDEVVVSINDAAGNTDSIKHTFGVDLYAVNLSLDSDVEYFSPNGDGIQDGVEFIDIQTDGEILFWNISIYDKNNTLLRKIQYVGGVKENVFWDGKYNPDRPELRGLKYVEDGEYSYQMHITTTDGVQFQTLPVSIYAKTGLEDEVVITSPKNGKVTTKGVINVQGQAPKNTDIFICIDTVGLESDCDVEYFARSNGTGGFSIISVLPRLEDQSVVEHYVWARAKDEYGNQTEKSNVVKVIADVNDPFLNVSVIPALTGVNNQKDYKKIKDKLDNNETITRQDIENLRSVVIRSVVTQNTERVKIRYSDLTNLDKIPEYPETKMIGYVDKAISQSETETGLFQEYTDGENPIFGCDEAECRWDMVYPVPPAKGGIYKIIFNAKKGETITEVSAGLMIDGTIPIAPVILDVNKIEKGENSNTTFFQDAHYSNSSKIEVRGGADPDTEISIYSKQEKLICETRTSDIGLFYCRVDLKDLYPGNSIAKKDLSIYAVASDGQNEQRSIGYTRIVIDLIKPKITTLDANNRWVRSGDRRTFSIETNEKVLWAKLELPYYYTNYSLKRDYMAGKASLIMPGSAKEGKVATKTIVSDIAGNKSSKKYYLFVDNTPPDTTTIDTTKWEKYSGVNSKEGMPSRGRLVPGYVYRGDSLRISGYSERDSTVNIFLNNKKIREVKANNSCIRAKKSSKTVDGVNVKSNVECEWSCSVGLSRDRGYVFYTRVTDRAGNQSNIGKDVLLYKDSKPPVMPEIENITDGGQRIPGNREMKIWQRSYGITVNAEALSDIQIWAETEDGKRLFEGSGKTSSQGIYQGMVKTEGLEAIGGKYILLIRSVDAAGNRSKTNKTTIICDNLAPPKPIVELYAKDGGLYARVAGESGTQLVLDGRATNTYIGSSGKIEIMIRETFQRGTKYSYSFALLDEYGNMGNYVEKEFYLKPKYIGGEGEETEIENTLYASSNRISEHGFDNTKVTVEVEVDGENNYKVTGYYVPTPTIDDIGISVDEYEISGSSVFVGIPLEIVLNKKEQRKSYTLRESIDNCGVSKVGRFLYISPSKRRCIESEMGWDEKSYVKHISRCGAWCLNDRGKEKIVSEKRVLGAYSFGVQHSLIHVYRNGVWDYPSEWPPWVPASSIGAGPRYTFGWPTYLVDSGDKISITNKIYGDYEINYYDNQTKKSIKIRLSGLESGRSNDFEIPDTDELVPKRRPLCGELYETQMYYCCYSHKDKAAVDLRVKDTNHPTGKQEVLATMSGVAEFRTSDASCGNEVRITNDMYMVKFCHLDSDTIGYYGNGDALESIQVSPGEVVGITDNSGNTTGAHLHYSIRVFDEELGDYRYATRTEMDNLWPPE